MTAELTYQDRAAGALYGMFIGDALAMPVHWYYNTSALKKDYGVVSDYMPPHNPHPDSILWRSSYTPRNKNVDILHNQAEYWGQQGIHYHQFLKAGENTLNLKIVGELLLMIKKQNQYSETKWLEHLVDYMTKPGCHNDTYVEEYLRHFFSQYGQGIDLTKCGRRDENHIGGLSLMLPLLMVYGQNRKIAYQTALNHLDLTHGGHSMQVGGKIIANIILDILHGESLEQSIRDHYPQKEGDTEGQPFETLFDFPNEWVVGKHFSSACYMEHSIPATLFLAVKYAKDPEQALISNTMCGGDNAGRGAVLGALLGAVGGLSCWPERWINGLMTPPEMVFLKIRE